MKTTLFTNVWKESDDLCGMFSSSIWQHRCYVTAKQRLFIIRVREKVITYAVPVLKVSNKQIRVDILNKDKWLTLSGATLH